MHTYAHVNYRITGFNHQETILITPQKSIVFFYYVRMSCDNIRIMSYACNVYSGIFHFSKEISSKFKQSHSY